MCPHVIIYTSKQKRQANNPYHPTANSLEFGISFLRRARMKNFSTPLGCDPTTLQAQSLRSIHSAKPGS
jgi:hypothetical protein